jgi:hypothetical protein
MTSPSLTLKMILLGTDQTASAALSSLATKASSLPTQLAGPLGKLGSLIGGEVGELVAKVSEGFNQIGEDSDGLGKKLAVGGAGLAGLGAAATLMGSKDASAAAQLKQAITDTGGAYSDYSEEIEKTIKTQENFGNSAVSTQQALQTLTSATGDPTKAIDSMGVTADLAAAKHISLSDAATLVSKVLNGTGTKTLKQYGITVESTTTATANLNGALKTQQTAQDALAAAQKKLLDLQTIDHSKKVMTVADNIALKNAQDAVTKANGNFLDAQEQANDAQEQAKDATNGNQDALDQLGKKLNGQASAAVDSWGGKLDVLKTKITDQVAVLGQRFGPALTVAGTGLTALGTVMDFVRGRQEAAATAAAAAAVATDAETVSTEAATVAQGEMDVALDANPIGAIILAIAALVAGLVLLVMHFKEVSTFLNGPWGTAISAAVAVMFPFIGIPMLVIGHYQSMWDFLKSFWAGIKGDTSATISTIVNAFNSFIGFFTALPGRFSAAAVGMFDGIKDAFKSAIDWVIRGWNSLRFTMPGIDTGIPGVGTIGGFSVGVPSIPLLALGGDLASAGSVIVGDRGPEMLQLPQGARVTPLNRSADPGQFGTQQVNLVVDGQTLASVVLPPLQRMKALGTQVGLG